MNRNILAFLSLASLASVANTPPEITNVRASQREGTKLVDIYYDAADADGDALKVRVEISDNDGLKYSVPAATFTGDIGEGVAVGKDKHIVWDAGKDWDGEYSDQMRVKVFAIDAQGFPGMEWSNEIPPGGFLMGQDGGVEGSGPSRHVNIPWSYWMGKYEVTCQQYCDFLNAALVSGYVSRDGTTSVYTMPGMIAGINGSYSIISLGDGNQIRWNVNNFEVVGNGTNFPVKVTWYGAMAFCRYYGYDLPTDAEWEKAARGPDHDDQDEHLLYPWGNTINSSCASYGWDFKPVGYYNGNQTPVGNDMISDYGIYDLIGNLAEWVRSKDDALETYDSIENLDSSRHFVESNSSRVGRGSGSDPIYQRWSEGSGFRVVRRSINDVSTAKSVGKLTFEGEPLGTISNFSRSVGGVTVRYVQGPAAFVTNIVDGVVSTVLQVASGTTYLEVVPQGGKIRAVRYSFRSSWRNVNYITLVSESAEGSSTRQEDARSGTEYTTGCQTFRDNATSYKIKLYSHSSSYEVWLKDLEFFTTPD